jgi:hypothetical protein
VPPVTSVVARWGRALGTACRRVCFLPRDRRGRRRGGAPSPAPSPAPSATRLDGFPRFRVANVIFSAAIVKVSLSISSPPRSACCRAPATPTAGDRHTGRTNYEPRVSNPFAPYRVTGLRGDNARTLYRSCCAVSRLQRTVPVGPRPAHATQESRHAPPRPPRTALTSGPPERRLAHAHKFECALAMADLPQASTSRPHASTGASGFAWQVPPLKARRRRRRRPVSACSDA